MTLDWLAAVEPRPAEEVAERLTWLVSGMGVTTSEFMAALEATARGLIAAQDRAETP